MIPVILIGFSFFSPPECTNVIVSNLLESQNLESIHLLLPDAVELIPVDLDAPIPPGDYREIQFPWGFINRVIFNTDAGNVYFQGGFSASSNPDTIRISRARKEFGGIFDRIHGTMPIGVRNISSINIASVHVTGEGIPEGDILGSNPLMPGELLRLWVQSREPYTLVFFDTYGFASDTLLESASSDTTYRVTNDMFFHNGILHSTSYPGYSITIANCISSEEIISIEAYDEQGSVIMFFDLTETPLRTWDRLATQVDYPPGFIICTDSEGREYSLNEADPETGIYEFDLLSLDFDFSFPERP